MKKSTLLFTGILFGTAIFAQAPKKVILEDYTGTWCGACPAGKTALEDCMNTYPNVIGLTMHNGDGLANAYTNAVDGALAISSYPGGAVDRTPVGLPSQWKTKVAARLNVATPVKVDFTSTYNTSTRALSVTVSANFVGSASGDLRINCVLAEDGIVTPNDPQHNYYGSGCMAPSSSSPWYSYPCDITTYVHDGVCRINLANDNFGTAGVIPASVVAGGNYSQTYTYTLPSGWNASKVYIIAFVSKYGSSKEIMNANKGLIGTSTLATGISEQAGSAQIEVKQNAPNPFSDLTAIQFQLNVSEKVSVKVYNTFGQVVNTLAESFLVPGEHTFYWAGDDNNGNAVASGIYYYTISTADQQVTKQMVYTGR